MTCRLSAGTARALSGNGEDALITAHRAGGLRFHRIALTVRNGPMSERIQFGLPTRTPIERVRCARDLLVRCLREGRFQNIPQVQEFCHQLQDEIRILNKKSKETK